MVAGTVVQVLSNAGAVSVSQAMQVGNISNSAAGSDLTMGDLQLVNYVDNRAGARLDLNSTTGWQLSFSPNNAVLSLNLFARNNDGGR